MQQVPDPAAFMQRRRLLQKGCRKSSLAVTSELAPKEVIEEEKDFEAISLVDAKECDERNRLIEMEREMLFKESDDVSNRIRSQLENIERVREQTRDAIEKSRRLISEYEREQEESDQRLQKLQCKLKYRSRVEEAWKML